jgi:membrane protease YdiL (CAAX protease family)
MIDANDVQDAHAQFSLTRMIYAVCGAIIFYKLLELVGWFMFSKIRKIPLGLDRFDLWLHAVNLFLVLAMLAISLPYGSRSELFRWSSVRTAVGVLKSVGLGVSGGVVALTLASPFLWFGGRQLGFIRLLIANSLSPLGVLDAALFIIGLAISCEMAYRGIVFRTLADYASMPSATVGSTLLFAYIYPGLGFPAAIILGIVSAILYYKTRSLLAPIIANVVLTVGGGALTLYHSLMVAR